MEEGRRNIALLKTMLAIAPLSKRDVIQTIGEDSKLEWWERFDIIIDVLIGCIGVDEFLTWYARQIISYNSNNTSTIPLPNIKPYMSRINEWGIAKLYAGPKEIVIVMESSQQIEQLPSIFHPHRVEIEDAGKVIKVTLQ